MAREPGPWFAQNGASLPIGTPVSRPSPWSPKILALLRANNPSAAIAQIKVAPSVRDLKALQKAMVDAQLVGRWKDVDVAIEESLRALSAPRLHRAP